MAPITLSSTLTLIAPKSPFLHPNTTRTAKISIICSKKDRSFIRYASISGPIEAETKLPDKKKPLYAHSLLMIEAWLRKLGFVQSKEDRAVWYAELDEWHAELSLDVTDLYIRYLKSGPGNLEKDVERRFSYALSREDIQNAILGGP